MNRAIEILMEEHRLIERVMDSFDALVARGPQGGATVRAALASYADFFRNFADRCHHGKEEDRLFVEMGHAGFPKDHGPIAVMLADHDEGRADVKAMAALGAGQGPLSDKEWEQLRAIYFTGRLREHIMKEDRVLYPMALQAVPPEVMDNLSTEFESFAAKVLGTDEYRRLCELGEKLISSQAQGR